MNAHCIWDGPDFKKFQLVGGNLSLDFANTMGGKRGVMTREYLSGFNRLLSWANQAGLIDRSQAETLAHRAAQEPAHAAGVLERAIELREVIYRIFAAISHKKAPVQEDLERLNAELARSLGRLQIGVRKRPAGFEWQWAKNGEGLDSPLGPIARAAAELLTNGHSLGQVRLCQGDTCGWLFVDSSKNHSRRWCDMRDCGNRAKARRHRAKSVLGEAN